MSSNDGTSHKSGSDGSKAKNDLQEIEDSCKSSNKSKDDCMGPTTSHKHQKEKKPELKDYFEYSVANKIKHGHCKLCGTDNNDRYIVNIRMKDSNTSGIRAHLKRKHLKEYEKVYPTDSNSAPVCKSQSSLKSYGIKVSIFLI